MRPIPLLPAIPLIHTRQRQKRAHGVDILGCPTLREAVPEPVLDDFQGSGVIGELVVVPEAVEPDAVRPFPAGPAFGVDYTAVVEPEEELAGGVVDGDEVVDEGFDLGVDGGGENSFVGERHVGSWCTYCWGSGGGRLGELGLLVGMESDSQYDSYCDCDKFWRSGAEEGVWMVKGMRHMFGY